MVVIYFIGLFTARYPDLIGIDHNNVVASIDMWGVLGLMFATQAAGDFCRQSAQDLVCGINHVPVTLDCLRLCAERLHCILLRSLNFVARKKRRNVNKITTNIQAIFACAGKYSENSQNSRQKNSTVKG